MGVIAKIRSWLMQEIVLVVSVVAAALSCIFVPFDGQYVTYIDWHTLALLFSLMSVVAGLRFLGVFRLLGEWVVAHTKTKAMIAFSLVGLSFVCSMVITNDVSLITFVPFAIVIMHQAKMDWYMGPVVALMTVAANLGSMLLPMGNPQNLYLFQVSGFDFASFVSLMAPYTAVSAVLLLAALVMLFRRGMRDARDAHSVQNANSIHNIHSETNTKHVVADHASKSRVTRHIPSKRKMGKALVYGVLFLVCLAAVLDVVNVFAVCVLVFVVVLVMDAKTLLRVDYGLLCTFVALFVFVGNMGRIPVIHDGIAQLVGIAPVVASALLSQIISNVPAALLLSGFTDQWQALIIGTNIGGLGTLIASMASIISFKLITTEGLVSRSAYLRTFTLYNVVFLFILLVFNAGLSVLG